MLIFSVLFELLKYIKHLFLFFGRFNSWSLLKSDCCVFVWGVWGGKTERDWFLFSFFFAIFIGVWFACVFSDFISEHIFLEIYPWYIYVAWVEAEFLLRGFMFASASCFWITSTLLQICFNLKSEVKVLQVPWIWATQALRDKCAVPKLHNFSFFFTSSSIMERGEKKFFSVLFCMVGLLLTPYSLRVNTPHCTRSGVTTHTVFCGILQKHWRYPPELTSKMVEIACFWFSSFLYRDIPYSSPGPGLSLLYLEFHTAVNAKTQHHQDWPVSSKTKLALVPASVSGYPFLLCFLFNFFFFLLLFLLPQISNFLVQSAILVKVCFNFMKSFN